MVYKGLPSGNDMIRKGGSVIRFYISSVKISINNIIYDNDNLIA